MWMEARREPFDLENGNIILCTKNDPKLTPGRALLVGIFGA